MVNARIKVTPMRALVSLLPYTYRLYTSKKSVASRAFERGKLNAYFKDPFSR